MPVSYHISSIAQTWTTILKTLMYNPQNEMLAAHKMKRLFLKNET